MGRMKWVVGGEVFAWIGRLEGSLWVGGGGWGCGSVRRMIWVVGVEVFAGIGRLGGGLELVWIGGGGRGCGPVRRMKWVVSGGGIFVW